MYTASISFTSGHVQLLMCLHSQREKNWKIDEICTAALNGSDSDISICSMLAANIERESDTRKRQMMRQMKELVV